MNASFKAINPEDLIMEMKISMSLQDWKTLRIQLTKEWPAWDLSDKIDQMVAQAEKNFYPKAE